MKQSINIVWFKRDLRVHDHLALYQACENGLALPIFCWDQSVWQGRDYAPQHKFFVSECLSSLKTDLNKLGLSLFNANLGIIDTLNLISNVYCINNLYSHEETGNHNTFQLDISVARWCKAHHINWHQYPQNGVVRRLKNRDTWTNIWHKRMSAECAPTPSYVKTVELPAEIQAHSFSHDAFVSEIHLDKPYRQKGGRKEALDVLQTFLNGRGSRYRGGISSPLSAENAGSRLSPYLSWGVISMREVVQALRKQRLTIQANEHLYPKGLLAGLASFESRLHWHCHFIQKLESEPSIEYRNLHSSFDNIRDESYDCPELEKRLACWKAGKTGWPLVDACMAMLKETGWINFRMRAMLMSTASYLLWLHWRETGLHLAREFLDYEPGIHWSQVQMQSGTTGINTLRIYNPIKQAIEQDPDGLFVRKWIPALKNVPNIWIFQPWLMTHSQQEIYGCKIGVDYPFPLVEFESSYQLAKSKFSQLKASETSKMETTRIIKRHASRKLSNSKKRSIKSKQKAPSSFKYQESLF